MRPSGSPNPDLSITQFSICRRDLSAHTTRLSRILCYRSEPGMELCGHPPSPVLENFNYSFVVGWNRCDESDSQRGKSFPLNKKNDSFLIELHVMRIETCFPSIPLLTISWASCIGNLCFRDRDQFNGKKQGNKVTVDGRVSGPIYPIHTTTTSPLFHRRNQHHRCPHHRSRTTSPPPPSSTPSSSSSSVAATLAGAQHHIITIYTTAASTLITTPSPPRHHHLLHRHQPPAATSVTMK
ncbi:hypothetical protein Tco_1093061, partial [Tanacetum coccineum]